MVGMTSTVQDATASENPRKRKRKASNSEIGRSIRHLEPSSRDRSWIPEAATVGESNSPCSSLYRGSALQHCAQKGSGDHVSQNQGVQSERRASLEAEDQGISGLAEAHVALGPGHSVDASAKLKDTEPAASDAAWLRSRKNRLLDLVDADETLMPKASGLDGGEHHSRIESPAPPVLDTSTQTEAQPSRESTSDEALKGPKIERNGLESGRLFIRNLPYTTTEKELREFFDFHNYGSIEEVRPSPNCVVLSSCCVRDEHPDRDSLCLANDVTRKSNLVDASQV